jgi:pyruvate, orthophosphate dikinase
MREQFKSSALEANLAQTRPQETRLSEKQQWFLNIAEKYWGVHKRLQDFFQEYNHPYPDYKSLFEGLHSISVADLWLFQAADAAEDALLFIASIYSEIIQREIDDQWVEEYVKTLCKFLAALGEYDDVPETVIHVCFSMLEICLAQHEEILIRNSGLLRTYLKRWGTRVNHCREACALTQRVLMSCCHFWQDTSRAEEWYESQRRLFNHDYKENVTIIGRPFFQELGKRIAEAKTWEEISRCLFFNDIANHFRRFAEEFSYPAEKIHYLIYLIHVPGMTGLQNHLLFDMNKLLQDVIPVLSEQETYTFTDNLFAQFSDLKSDLTGTILDCQNTIGKEIAKVQNPKLISYYIKKLVHYGFIHPGEVRINEDWQTEVNRHHIKNIRIWLELIRNSPWQYRELLAALIVNLKLGGIFVSDTDLLQRDISGLLNSEIGSMYRQVKQLARIFPVFFREIGAEGKLRDVTTAMDELFQRKDRLIHFLRKQVHSESNNTHIRLTEEIGLYWETGDSTNLAHILPEDVAAALEIDDPYYRSMHRLFKKACSHFATDSVGFLHLEDEKITDYLNQQQDVSEKDRKKCLYLVQLYHLLLEKYSFETKDIARILTGSAVISAEEGRGLEALMEDGSTTEALAVVYSWMTRLKERILDPEQTGAVEQIYYKRHIAIGIPSMYGQYSEPKFEALGLMYRLERVASKLMLGLVENCRMDYLTTQTFSNVYGVLNCFLEGLRLDGVENQSFESNLEMFRYCLTSQSFTLDQYIDIFHFMAQSVKEIINEYFLRVYDETLTVVVPQVVSGTEQDHLRITEVFYRDILSSAFLIQELDSFITYLTDRLADISERHSPQIIHDMLTFNPELLISPFNEASAGVDNQVFMGAKAYYLKKLTGFGFPVPPGIVLTTELFRHRRTVFTLPDMKKRIEEDIRSSVRCIEQATGLEFGNPENPLLLSTRSGTAVSMPGAMSTFLNVGINESIASSGNEDPEEAWMRWDAYRRFLQSWGMSFEVSRDDFDKIMIEFKQRYDVEQKILFAWQQMREMALAYRRLLVERGIHVIDEPTAQLMYTVRSVMESWDSRRAKSYRKHLRIADEWGTAVIIQKMVMGNRSKRAGSGVLFTHNPRIKRPGIHPYGDFTLCSQGEDIVSGLVYPLPISEDQRQDSYSDSEFSLQTAFPLIYDQLLHYAHLLLAEYDFNHQEIEFTFESDQPEDLYILQIREQNIHGQKAQPVFTQAPSLDRMLGRGIGIYGGCLSGRAVFSNEDFVRYRHYELKTPLILLRPDTVPDDIPMIFQSDGLLTSRGGVTSHAAVTAAKLGKVCIVNCRDLKVDEMKKEAIINGVTIRPGDYLSLDGTSGSIYYGWNPVTAATVAQSSFN